MIVRPEEEPLVEGQRNPLVMRRLIDKARHGDDLSVNWIQLWGAHGRLRSVRSTRLYYILAGDGWFQVDEDHRGAVRTGDLVVISRGQPYAFGGHMTYLLVNQPAFVEGDDEFLDGPEPSK